MNERGSGRILAPLFFEKPQKLNDMDKATFVKRNAIWAAIITAIIIAVVKIANWNIIEANAFEEITKMIFGGLGVCVIVAILVFLVSLPLYHHTKWGKSDAKGGK